jgi:hypothetical protein
MTRYYLLIALALAVLPGCAENIKRADPIPQEGEMTRRITWVVSNDPHADCQKLGKRPLFFKTLGCAVWKETSCTIYTRAPRNEDDRRAMETMGHEMLHCFVGHFHRPS